jgi:hypothetical protein
MEIEVDEDRHHRGRFGGIATYPFDGLFELRRRYLLHSLLL